MIDDVLKLSFFDEGANSALPFIKIELKNMVEKIIKNLELVAQNKDVKLQFNAQNQSDGFEILGVSELIETCIFNLIENAKSITTLAVA